MPHYIEKQTMYQKDSALIEIMKHSEIAAELNSELLIYLNNHPVLQNALISIGRRLDAISYIAQDLHIPNFSKNARNFDLVVNFIEDEIIDADSLGNDELGGLKAKGVEHA